MTRQHGTAGTERVGLLVVGGGPAALAAATAYRDHRGDGPIVVVSDDDALPYFRPALSKEYLRGEAGAEDIGLADANSYAERDIEVRLSRSVAKLDAQDRSATLFDGTRLDYRSCVLATGARPKPLPVPGAHDRRVAYLRSLRSAESLRAAAEQARHVVVIGSGFIGCEAAASLASRGAQVSVVSMEELPQRDRLGQRAAERIAEWLAEQGVRLFGGASVEAIEDGQLVRLEGREPVRGELVLIAAGIEPLVEPVASSEVRMHEGRVVVDECMRSSAEGLFAAGDVAFARNASAGRHLAVEHWGEAMEMGTIAGATAAGSERRWDQAPGFWSAIGQRTLKYAAWGDGYEQTRFDDHGDGFTVWYFSAGRVVGVLTHDAEQDYERGRDLVESSASATDA